jgi:hypothetical protein
MKTRSRVVLTAFILWTGLLGIAKVYGQSSDSAMQVKTGRFYCSPAPCVLPPTQASEGGNPVTDTPIVSSPLSPKQLLLGSVDGNCPRPSVLGFHISNDGGSTWKRTCMISYITKYAVFWPSGEPAVGYDRKGAIYIAGLYNSSDSGKSIFAFQKSTDGTRWSKPAVAINEPGGDAAETWLAVDVNAGSPRVNSLYVSALMELNQDRSQILVSHSTDGGATWTQVGVDAVQKYPEEDHFTRMTIGKDGTVYSTWMRCRGKKGGDGSALCRTAHMMFSKSTDGGNTWSLAQQIATVGMPHYWWLPNSDPGVGVDNYPAIAVDNSDGSHAGNLYVAMYTWTGAYLRVQVVRSSDGGTTWSQPVPLAPKTDTKDQFFPSISVSSTGQVGVSWLDRRNDPADIDYQAFAAVSTDGGQTFPNTQLTKAFSNPNTNGGNNWMGDYTGNTWSEDTFIAAWMDSSNGVDMQEVVGGVRLK